MDSRDHKINELTMKLNQLINQHKLNEAEIRKLKQEVILLRSGVSETNTKEDKAPVFKEEITKPKVLPSSSQTILSQTTNKTPKPSILDNLPKDKKDWESFVGGNLMNKVGILITIIGVAILGKYSIDKGLVTPVMRIILGYLIGGGLLFFAFRLKEKYKTFSAVLLGGGVVVLYFITFFAHIEYNLIPKMLTFVIMLAITAFTVLAAIKYDEKVIAILGLVGAYAIPFLLSDGTGDVRMLFSYMLIVNIGIFFVAYKKYWKSLYYIAFAFTWLIALTWFGSKYDETYFTTALLFITLFFIVFYAMFLVYKLVQKEKFVASDIFLVILNSFIYFFLGFAIIEFIPEGEAYLGLFTVFNALIHFIVGSLIFKQQDQEKGLFYLALGMVLVFLTIAIPIQLDGNWVTILWALEGVLLFWIGRYKGIAIYEKMAYPVILICFFSLLEDWGNSYWDFGYQDDFPVIFNEYFLTSLIVMISFSWICYAFFKKALKENVIQQWVSKLMKIALPILLILVTYLGFKNEISHFFELQFLASEVANVGEYAVSEYNYNIRTFESIWILNYSVVFITGMLLFFYFKFRKTQLYMPLSGLVAIITTIFLTTGLYMISELREAYLLDDSEYYAVSIWYVLIRYITIVIALIMIYVFNRFIKPAKELKQIQLIINIALHVALLWVITSELIHWLNLSGSKNQYKLGVSILWGLYSLALVSYGLWKKEKLFRIGGISLFGITLLKLFFYDIAHLPTLSKIIVFILLGILLLIISFLYNKFKDRVAEGTEQKETSIDYE